MTVENPRSGRPFGISVVVNHPVAGIVWGINVDDANFFGEERKKKLQDLEVVSLDKKMAAKVKDWARIKESFGGFEGLFFRQRSAGPDEPGPFEFTGNCVPPLKKLVFLTLPNHYSLTSRKEKGGGLLIPYGG